MSQPCGSSWTATSAGPVRHPSYKVGERVWLEARADAQRRQGSAFDLRQFHADALNLGPLGLDPLRVALARL